MLKRMKCINFWGMLLFLGCISQTVFAAGPGTWEYYQSHFISSDGRVIDYFHEESSHSEGQGYGMLLAVYYNAPKTFERLLSWTRNNIMVRKDNLTAWRWGKRPTGDWGVLDYNNATDGDLLIAWALLTAARKWNQPELRSDALAIAGSIKKKLIIQKQDRILLMPAIYGFEGEKGARLNPSYFIYPAFEQFAREGDAEFWQMLSAHCLDISFHPLFTRLNLPADWVIIDGKGAIDLNPEKSRTFGYEAIRIPLYLSMSENREPLKAFSQYLRFYERLGYLPAEVDLEEEQVSIDEAPAGFYAVFALCAKMLDRQDLSRRLMKAASEKIAGEPLDYYSNTLYLIARKVMLP